MHDHYGESTIVVTSCRSQDRVAIDEPLLNTNADGNEKRYWTPASRIVFGACGWPHVPQNEACAKEEISSEKKALGRNQSTVKLIKSDNMEQKFDH